VNKKMQMFHADLLQSVEVFNPQADVLVQLTQVNPDQMRALRSDMDWSTWGTAPA